MANQPTAVVPVDGHDDPKRIAKDGQQITVGMMMMDGSQRVAADRSSADEAYTNYVKQISDAWQTPTDEPTLRKDRGEGVADAGASPL